MLKRNCWEFKKCGREPGGRRADELGVCAAATHKRMHGVNGGINGGRICWVVAGTYSTYRVSNLECSMAKNIKSCMSCEFHRQVLKEEGFIGEGFDIVMPPFVEIVEEERYIYNS